MSSKNPKPRIHGVQGVQGGSGVTLVAALMAVQWAEAGEKVLLVARPGDCDSMMLYLGMDRHADLVGEPPPPAGELTPELKATPLDGLWLLEPTGAVPETEILREFAGDRVVVDSPKGPCDQIEWVGRPEPSGIARLRDQVAAQDSERPARVWLNGRRDDKDALAGEQLSIFWTQARGVDGIPVETLPWHEGAWRAQRNRLDLRASGWSPLRKAARSALIERELP